MAAPEPIPIALHDSLQDFVCPPQLIRYCGEVCPFPETEVNPAPS